MLHQSTLIFFLIASTVLSTGLLVSAALYSESLGEQRLWALGNVASCLGLAISGLSMAGYPLVVHAVLSYGLMGLGLAVVLRGLLIFCGRDLKLRWVAGFTLLAMALPGYYTFIDPNLDARLVVTGLYFGVFNWVCAAALVRYSDRRQIWVAVFGFAGLGLSLLLRGAYLLMVPSHDEVTEEKLMSISLFVAPLAQTCIVFGLTLMISQRYAATLKRLSTLDALTGALNRSALNTFGQRIIQRARRGRRCVSVVMVDADHFKNVNDTYGHPAGDEVLRHLTRLLTSQMRPNDLLARYGGEEFALVFDGLNLANTVAVADRQRQQLESTPVVADGHSISYTVSMGAACSDEHGYDLAKLIAAADAALYAAKNAGRNRVSAASKVDA